MSEALHPKRGEIWLVEFEPARGAEIAKIRPAVIVSSNDIGKLPLRILVPVTDWKDHYYDFPWFTLLNPSRANGLTKSSGADAFQCKSFSLERFKKKLGKVTEAELEEIVSAIALCIGFS